MATIEQYGSGPYGVRIVDADRDFVGSYRFETPEEAREFRAKNGGRPFRSRRPLVPIVELGRMRAAGRREGG